MNDQSSMETAPAIRDADGFAQGYATALANLWEATHDRELCLDVAGCWNLEDFEHLFLPSHMASLREMFGASTN